MAKFLNKKEQVFDLQLTTYGKYLMSIGKMQPVYYAFFDDNILYDSQYAFTGSGVPSERYEPQNEIHGRIKNDTQYFEGLVQFTDIDNLQDQIENEGDIHFVDATPTQQIPKLDKFIYENSIGDAYMDNNKDVYAPAWKVVTLQNKISSSSDFDKDLLSKVPQVDMTLYYEKRISNAATSLNPTSVREFTNRTTNFADGMYINLETDDALMYIEELNTILLNENFDIEVFEQTTESTVGAFSEARITFIHMEGDLPIVDGDTVKLERNDYSVTFTFKNSVSTATQVQIATVSGGSGATCTDFWNALVETIINLGDKLNTDTGDGETYAQKLDFSVNYDTSIYENPCGTEKANPSILFEANTLGADEGTITVTANDYPTKWQLTEWEGGENSNVERSYKRKFFKKEIDNIQDGFMISNRTMPLPATSITTASVEYYFDMQFDQQIDPVLACKGIESFNKESYYVDLDFECDLSTEEAIYFDIYGNATEPEICQ